MRYFVINASNGYCGFEDKWVVKTEDDSWEPSEGGYILDTYVYAEGGGGLDPYDGEEYDSYDDYQQCTRLYLLKVRIEPRRGTCRGIRIHL